MLLKSSLPFLSSTHTNFHRKMTSHLMGFKKSRFLLIFTVVLPLLNLKVQFFPLHLYWITKSLCLSGKHSDEHYFKKNSESLLPTPSLEQVFLFMQSFESYRSIFPQTFKLVSILLTIPVWTATVERSFSHMKIIKNRLRNRLSDASLDKLMRVAIEGPDFKCKF